MASSGWSVGACASVALVTIGASAQADTRSAQQPIVSNRYHECGTDGDENTEHPEIAVANLLPDLLQFSARSTGSLCTA
jgi:hypothetical protein